jgi:hypothetical protein
VATTCYTQRAPITDGSCHCFDIKNQTRSRVFSLNYRYLQIYKYTNRTLELTWSGVEWSGGFLKAVNEMAGKGEPVMVMGCRDGDGVPVMGCR